MKRQLVCAVTGMLALSLTACALPRGSADPAMNTADTHVVSDEFDGPAGPVGGVWTAETGGGGWGNGEQQVYTDSTDNVRLDGKGHLLISARRDGDTITSARLTTRGKYSLLYGTVSARISLPSGQGLHPAFWLLGDSLDEVGWPRAGEIDVIETLNAATDYHTGIHTPADSDPRGQNLSASGPAPFPLADTFHTYWIRKSPGHIVTGIDDRELFSVTPSDLAADSQWVFDAPFHVLLNVAVGGDWPGPPSADTTFPATMTVDWIRVTTTERSSGT